MTLSSGARLGPYEIAEPIGAGGMGEVYRARDTRLDRTVAIKVLPAHSADRPEVRQRFEREARAASALNHPHICTLHDIGRQDDIDYLVMEYLEGETLADRLRKGAMPLDQSLRIATQVADALDRAHRTGITHRDLKPGNIMLTKDGAKVLDFGLAKIRERGAGPAMSGGSVMATLTSPLTGEGSIVGTLQYMSPEQLEGQEADARSDIFAFGSVLYEMVAGRRPFEAKTQASLIARILEHDVAPLSSIVPSAPPALEQLLRSCLAKDPDERRQNMHDVLVDLRWIAEGGSRAGIPTPVPAPRKARPVAWMAACAVLALAAVTLAILYWQRPRPESPMVRFTIPPPEKQGFGYGLTISQDGKRVAFVAAAAEGQPQLWIRSLDSLASQPIPGTEGASFPFWSPDGRSVGFFAGGKLNKVDTVGGPVQNLADAPDPRGGAWNEAGVILFAPNTTSPLQRVSASGGSAAVEVTRLDGTRKEHSHRWPHFLPDGRHFLCFSYIGGSANAIATGSLDSKDLTILTPADSAPAYSSGFLSYVRGSILMAQPFDAGRLRLSGDAVAVAQGVAAEGEIGPTAFSRFSFSHNGVLVYKTGSSEAGQFTWFDRAGKPLGTVGDSGTYAAPALSPDQRRLIFDWNETPAGNILWEWNLSRNVKSRFSFGSVQDSSAVWSPDGSTVVYASKRAVAADLYSKPATNAGKEQLLFASQFDKYPNCWTLDGRTVVFELYAPKRKTELWTLSVADRKAAPYLQSEFDVAHSSVSPDGHWLAYSSDESGRPEIYVQSFPIPTGGKYTISPAGGDQPSWRRDGKELFYIARDQKLMAVPVATGAAFEAQAPRALFTARVDNAPLTLTGARNSYVASGDGQKFLVYTVSDAVSTTPITVVLNWNAGIAR